MNNHIKSISWKNFQSHKHTVLHMHQCVNVIVGLSDAGKSALLRGINWVIRNRSDDKGFRSRWGGKTDVEIIYADGKEVSRVQDKNNAYYLIDRVNNVDEEYVAFKTDIPEDIVEALNMDAHNIQSQFDPPFLLAESSGDVAKYLNKIANLTDIDKAISNIRSFVLSNSKEASNTESNIVQFEKQLEEFSYLDEMEFDVIVLESLEKENSEIQTSIANLTSIIDHVSINEKELHEIDLFLKAEVPLSQALTLLEQEKGLVTEIQALQWYIAAIENDRKDLIAIEALIPAEKDCDFALSLIDELKEINNQGLALHKIIIQLDSDSKKLDVIQTRIRFNEIEFKR